MEIIDSTGIIELVSYLEDAFRINVDDEEIVPENMDSLINIEKYVLSKIA
jgi:acyl carrier protein